MSYPDPQLMLAPPQPTPSRRSAVLRAITMALLCFLLLSGSTILVFTAKTMAEPLAPTAPGSIAGTVQTSQGTPQAGAEVTLYQFSLISTPPWQGLRTMTTQSDGRYRFALLPAGVYRIGAVDPQRTYAPTYYPAAPTLATGGDLSVVGNQLANIDITLQPGGTLTGVVMITGSLSVIEGYVELYQEVERSDGLAWESVQRLTLPTTGSYAFTGLSTQPYRICANIAYEIFGWNECYPNASYVDEATSLTVTAGTTLSNVNLLLGEIVNNVSSSRLGGRVTSLTNEPLAGIKIYANPLGQQRSAVHPDDRHPQKRTSLPIAGSYLYTDQEGNYTLAASGSYMLYFADPAGQYAFEYYDNATTYEAATVVEVAENTIITNLNVQLAPASHIQGALTLFGQPGVTDFVTAEMKTPSGWRWANGAQIDGATGRYDIDGLPAGIYRVYAETYSAGPYGYRGYYGGSSLETAAAITLAIGVTFTADITLTGEQTFTGAVSGQVFANGAPLAGAKVYLYRGIMDCCASALPPPLVYVITDAEGRYTISGLTTNLYWLSAVDPNNIYATTYYSKQAVPAAAGSLYIEDGIVFTETNITMPLAGALSGRVLTAKGKAVAGLQVAVYAADPTFDPSYNTIRLVSSAARTDAEGRYLVPGLHATSYYVCFTTVQSTNYGECYGRPQVSEYDVGGTPVNVVAGATTTDVDLIWGPDPGYYLPLIAR